MTDANRYSSKNIFIRKGKEYQNLSTIKQYAFNNKTMTLQLIVVTTERIYDLLLNIY